MTVEHEPAHEEVLADILAAGGGDPALPEPLASCARCREEAAALAGLARTLERHGAQERRFLAEAGAEEGVDPLVVRVLARELEAQRPRPLPRVRLSRLLVAAAALLLLVPLVRLVLDTGGGEGPAPAPDGVLLGPSLDMRPSGDVSGPISFHWSGPLPPGGSYSVRVLDATGAEVLRVDGLREPQWTPTAAESAKLPRVFTWEVLVFDAVGEPVRRDARSVRRVGS